MEPLLHPIFHIFIGLLHRVRDMNHSDQTPFAAVHGFAMRLGFGFDHVPMERQSVKSCCRGCPNRQQTSTMTSGQTRPGRRGHRRSCDVEQWIGIWPQMQPRLAQIPSVVLERQRLITLQQVHDAPKAVFQETAGLRGFNTDHLGIRWQGTGPNAQHDAPPGEVIQLNDPFRDP